MAVNIQKYAKRFEELKKQGKSTGEAHAQATREASQKEGGTVAKKKGKGKLYELLMGRRAYGAAAANKKIKKEITADKFETTRTEAIERGLDTAGLTEAEKKRLRGKRRTVLTGNN